jgi:hypothetical protein
VLAAQSVAKRFSAHERHHVEDAVVRLARIVQREDVRMLEPRRELDLVQEPAGAEEGADLGPQQLHGDFAVMLGVTRQVDGRHPALPDGPLHDVPLAE